MYSTNMNGIHGHIFCKLTDLNVAFCCILGIRAGGGAAAEAGFGLGGYPSSFTPVGFQHQEITML